MAQLVRAPPCHGGGREFESLLGRYGIIAQLGEHLPYKQRVIGSSPIGPIDMDGFPSGQRGQTVNLLATPSKVRIRSLRLFMLLRICFSALLASSLISSSEMMHLSISFERGVSGSSPSK